MHVQARPIETTASLLMTSNGNEMAEAGGQLILECCLLVSCLAYFRA
jgi:hypothetical protein